jgi:hypothetical protein
MKAVLVTPTYGNVDPLCAKDLRVAMMTASNHGLHWTADASPDRVGFAAARNEGANLTWKLGKDETDGAMWIDSDIRMHPAEILRLLDSVKKQKADFATGVYHQRGPLYQPVFYHFSKPKKKFQPFMDYPSNSWYPIEGCGFGFVWTSWTLLDKIRNLKTFDKAEGWFPDKRDLPEGFGEDLEFCRHAMNAGVQLYVNTAVMLGHTGEPRVIYRKDFIDEHERWLAEPEGKRASVVPKNWGVLDEDQ